ncbi:MAG TPA: homoserine kinase [Mycobacteriales bacterium]|nr:homoserine kinase [Mycobacteriales bacterium]
MAGPSFRAAPVRVRVPATSANLGPGFDSLGLALALYDDVVVRIADSGLHVDVAGEGAEDLPRDKRHLVVRAVRAAFDALGGQPRGLEVVCANRIPQGRGLGSSAAAIVAGITAARHLVLGGMTDHDALALAVALEGHPDNVAAALLGGLTVAWSGATDVRATRIGLHPDLCAVVLVPNSRSSTAKARRMLPETVPHADAAWSAGRAALLVEAVSRTPDLLFDATEDVLHQPYRAEAMPRTAALLRSLRGKGVAAAISGAGPSLIALGVSPGELDAVAAGAPRGWTAQRLDIDRNGAQAVPVGG